MSVVQFSKAFLTENGLTTLTRIQENKFLEIVQEELEVRVGHKLSEGVPPWKIEEFENLIDNSAEENKAWLVQHYPKYQTYKIYNLLSEKGFKGDELINEFVSLLWLQENRPDYKKIAEQCFNEIKKEVKDYLPAILGTVCLYNTS